MEGVCFVNACDFCGMVHRFADEITEIVEGVCFMNAGDFCGIDTSICRRDY